MNSMSRSWALKALRKGEEMAAALGAKVSLLRMSVRAGVSQATCCI